MLDESTCFWNSKSTSRAYISLPFLFLRLTRIHWKDWNPRAVSAAARVINLLSPSWEPGSPELDVSSQDYTQRRRTLTIIAHARDEVAPREEFFVPAPFSPPRKRDRARSLARAQSSLKCMLIGRVRRVAIHFIVRHLISRLCQPFRMRRRRLEAMTEKKCVRSELITFARTSFI